MTLQEAETGSLLRCSAPSRVWRRAASSLLEMEGNLDALRQAGARTRNRRAWKKVEQISGPFVERWTPEIESLKSRIGKEEPYDAYSAVEKTRALFKKEFEGVENSLHGIRPIS